MARKHRKNPQHLCGSVCSVLFDFLSHMDCCTPGFPILHHLLELAQTHVHWRCHPSLLASVIPFSTCLQTFPVPGFFSNESDLCIWWRKYWIFSFSISLSNEYSGLISFRIDWFDLFAVQGTLKSLLQNYSSKAQFFDAQSSLWSSSHIHTWLLKNP